MVSNYKSVVNKRDIVWFLGDILFEEKYLEVLADLPGTKNLILGNHDTDRKVNTEQLVKVFDSVHGLVKYKDAWLSHAPIHPCELRGRINIHGHMHYQTVGDKNYVNVCVEHTGMTPIKYQKIVDKFN